MYFENKKYENLFDNLLDINQGKSGISKGADLNDDDRYKLS